MTIWIISFPSTLRLADQSLLKILLEFLNSQISNDDDTCNFIFDLTNDSFRKFRLQSLSPTRTTIPPTTPNTPEIKTSLLTYPTTNPNVTQRDRDRFSRTHSTSTGSCSSIQSIIRPKRLLSSQHLTDPRKNGNTSKEAS